MGVVIKNIDIQAAKNMTTEYDYALIYMMSQLVFRATSELGEINWDECLEARFFSGEKELHIFDDGGELVAVSVEENGDCEKQIKEYKLANKFILVGKALKVCEYIDYDDDGQAYVTLTRLAGVE